MIVSGIGKTYSKSNIAYSFEKQNRHDKTTQAPIFDTLTFKGFTDLFKPSPKKFAENFLSSKNTEEFASNITNAFPEARFLMTKNKTFKKNLYRIKDALVNDKSQAHEFFTKTMENPNTLMGVVFLLMGNAAIESYHYTKLLKKSNVYTPAQVNEMVNDNNKILDAILENWENMLPSFSNLSCRTQKDIKSVLKSDFKPSKAETMEINVFDIEEYKKLSDNAKSIMLTTYFIKEANNESALRTADILSHSREKSSDEIIQSLVTSALNEIEYNQGNNIALGYLSGIFGPAKRDIVKSAFATLPKQTFETLDNAYRKGLKIQNAKDLLNNLYSEIHKQQKNKQKSMLLTIKVLGEIYDCIINQPATKEGYKVSPVLIRDANQPIEWLKEIKFYQDSNGIIHPKYIGDQIPALILASAFKKPWASSSIKTIENFLDNKSNNIYLPQIFEPKYRHGFNEDEIHLSKEEFIQALQYLPDEYKAKLLMSDFASKYEDYKYDLAKKIIPNLYAKEISKNA